MFGPVRAAHLRAPAANTDQDMQLYNRRNKVVAALASRGRHAPVDFAPDIIFYSFQQDHHAMLRSPALTERKLEDWAYGFGRWSIPQADDPCNGSDFQNMLLLASKCETDLTAALQASALVSGVPIRPSLRREINASGRVSAARRWACPPLAAGRVCRSPRRVSAARRWACTLLAAGRVRRSPLAAGRVRRSPLGVSAARRWACPPLAARRWA